MAKRTDPEGTQLAGIRSLVSFDRKRVLEIGSGDGRLTIGIPATRRPSSGVERFAEETRDMHDALGLHSSSAWSSTCRRSAPQEASRSTANQ